MRICSVPDCERKHRRNGFCEAHDVRVKRGKRGLEPETPISRFRGGFIDKDGYRHMKVGNESVLYHRAVMAEIMGRPLRKDETVHHRNGDRADNRSENLELWTGRHVRGSRIEDAVANAVFILETYAPKLLNHDELNTFDPNAALLILAPPMRGG